MKSKQSKITVFAVLAAVTMVGIFAFTPIYQASTVHDTLLANALLLVENTDNEALDLTEADGSGIITVSVEGNGCLAVTSFIVAPTSGDAADDIDAGERLRMFEGDAAGEGIAVAGVEHDNISDEDIRAFAEGGNELVNALLSDISSNTSNSQERNVANQKWTICDDDTIVVDYTFDTAADAGANADDGITFEAKVIGWISAGDDFTVTITED